MLRIVTGEVYVASEVVAALTERTGIEIEISSFENTEDLVGILRAYSHRYDLIFFDNSSVGRFRHNQLLLELDHERLEGFENLDSKFENTQSDLGNKHSVPYLRALPW